METIFLILYTLFLALVIAFPTIVVMREIQLHLIQKGWIRQLKNQHELMVRGPQLYTHLINQTGRPNIERIIVDTLLPDWWKAVPKWAWKPARLFCLRRDLEFSMEVGAIRSLILQRYHERHSCSSRTDALEEEYFKRNPV